MTPLQYDETDKEHVAKLAAALGVTGFRIFDDEFDGAPTRAYEFYVGKERYGSAMPKDTRPLSEQVVDFEVRERQRAALTGREPKEVTAAFVMSLPDKVLAQAASRAMLTLVAMGVVKPRPSLVLVPGA